MTEAPGDGGYVPSDGADAKAGDGPEIGWNPELDVVSDTGEYDEAPKSEGGAEYDEAGGP